MTTFNWIILAITLLGWAVTYGKFCQKVNQIDKDVARVDTEINELHQWGESEVTRAVRDRNENFVRRDVYEARHAELERCYHEIAALKLPATLARIESKQDQLTIDIADMKVLLHQLMSNK